MKDNNRYNGFYNRFLKRVIGLFLAIALTIPLFPVYALIGFMIWHEDGFPIFYCPLRGGYRGKPFHIMKFRTMVKNADKIGGGTTALNDPRITKIGCFLRKMKLDEIPQLFNIIFGSMSFIGPRPELLRYVSEYTEAEKVILEVRPGITDYSSVEFIHLDEIVGAENADEAYEKYVLKRKNQLRMQYAHDVSFQTDTKLFFKTVRAVLSNMLAVVFKKRENGTRRDREIK